MQRLKPLPKPARSDAVLAAVFLENATVKAAAAEWAADQGFDNQALHAIAIAIELLLKSYLLNVATDDVWNRANIGHDLAKALHYSAQAGLVPPSRIEWIISHLHPHFQRGGFQREPSRKWPPGFADDAGEVARQLAQTVRPLNIKGAQIYGRKFRSRTATGFRATVEGRRRVELCRSSRPSERDAIHNTST